MCLRVPKARFRDRLQRKGLLDRLMAELGRQLDGHGVMLRQGTLIDASLIDSAARRPIFLPSVSSPIAAPSANCVTESMGSNSPLLANVERVS